jgi:hypothetical protein
MANKRSMKNPLRISTLVFCLFAISTSAVFANYYYLNGAPGYAFPSGPTGAVPPYQPDTYAMAVAISSLWGGAPIATDGYLTNQNTAYPPVVADSNVPPYYVFGPGPSGTIKNLNLNTVVVSGIASGRLIYTGTDLFAGWAYMNRFVLRVYTATQFYDVLVKVNSWSGETTPNTYYATSWSFYQVSAARPIPPPVVVTSAVSRKTHGSAGTFDLSLPLTGTHGIECRKGGASQAFTVIVTFSNTLTSVNTVGVTSGTGTISSSGIGGDTHQYIFNLTNVSNAQHFALTMNGVTDSAGNISDTVTIPMDMLIADTNASTTVSSADVTQVQGQVGQPVTASNFREDIDASGAIDSTDVTTATNKKGTHLP